MQVNKELSLEVYLHPIRQNLLFQDGREGSVARQRGLLLVAVVAVVGGGVSTTDLNANDVGIREEEQKHADAVYEGLTREMFGGY
jgi:hypothetical protein